MTRQKHVVVVVLWRVLYSFFFLMKNVYKCSYANISNIIKPITQVYPYVFHTPTHKKKNVFKIYIEFCYISI